MHMLMKAVRRHAKLPTQHCIITSQLTLLAELSGTAAVRRCPGPLRGTFGGQQPQPSFLDARSQAATSSFTTNVTGTDDDTDVDVDEETIL